VKDPPQICCSCMSGTVFCDMNFIYGLYHDCARTLQRSFPGKLAIVQLLSGFSFARNSSRAPCALASFSRARMPCSACTRDVTCELYCSSTIMFLAPKNPRNNLTAWSIACMATKWLCQLSIGRFTEKILRKIYGLLELLLKYNSMVQILVIPWPLGIHPIYMPTPSG